MWLVELLQKSIPHFAVTAEAKGSVDVTRIRDIRVRLFKHATTEPKAVARTSDDDLVDALCMLRLELDALPREHPLRTDPASRGAIATIYAELDRLLGDDVPFRETDALDKALHHLSETIGANTRRRERRRRTTRSLTFVVTVVPLLAYGTHWALGNFYRQALIDDIDIAYPQNAFEYADGEFRLRDALRTQSLQLFRNYYFRETVPEPSTRNPLPLAFHAESAAALGVELPAQIREGLEAGAISPRELDTNLFMFRVFVRNIRDNNIVNHLRVRAERIAERRFPWREMDVETEIRFAAEPLLLEGGLSVTVETSRTPVVNMTLDMRLADTDGGVGETVRAQLDALTSTRSLTPDFDSELLIAPAGKPVFVRLSPDRAATVVLDSARRRTADEAYHELGPTEGRLADDEYLFLECPDDGVAVLGNPQTLQRLLGLASISAVEIDYRYEQLDGTDRSGRQTLAVEPPALRMHGGLSGRLDEVEECAGVLVFALFDLPAAAAGPDDWLNVLDKFALMLAERPGQKAPVIVAEETVVFDFESERHALDGGSSQIHILKDGEYVLFTVVATNFRGGDYRFEFYFDDERVAELKAALEWPESLRFETGDEAFFRRQPDAAANAR